MYRHELNVNQHSGKGLKMVCCSHSVGGEIRNVRNVTSQTNGEPGELRVVALSTSAWCCCASPLSLLYSSGTLVLFNNMWTGPSSIVLVVRTSGHSVYNICMADACCENFPQPWDVTAIRLLDLFIPFVFVTLWFLAQQPANRLAVSLAATFQRVILNRLRINSVSGTFFCN